MKDMANMDQTSCPFFVMDDGKTYAGKLTRKAQRYGVLAKVQVSIKDNTQFN